MIEGILGKFDLGEYDPALCGLAEHFDERLLKHLEYLRTVGINQIRYDSSIDATGYDQTCFQIFKSYGFVSLMYATLLLDITLLQADNGRWSYTAKCQYEHALEKHVGGVGICLSITLKRKNIILQILPYHATKFLMAIELRLMFLTGSRKMVDQIAEFL